MVQACGLLKICGDGGTESELKEFRTEEEEGGGGGRRRRRRREEGGGGRRRRRRRRRRRGNNKNEEVGEKQKCAHGEIIEV